jgi:membrane protein YqaA with SNARE-associated domain
MELESLQLWVPHADQPHMTSITTYALLFLSAFLAATILPISSDPVLAGALGMSLEPWWALIAVATIGNTLGSVVNWGMGLGIERFKNRRWFPVSETQLERAKYHYGRWGRWCLLFAWLPVVGDAFTVLAGVLKERLWVFVALVGLGKLFRYLLIAFGVAGLGLA